MMDPIIELSNAFTLLNQQLIMRQIANEYHQRVKNQVRNPHMRMAQVPYGGTPYWNNYNSSFGNIALTPQGIQAISLCTLHMSKDQA